MTQGKKSIQSGSDRLELHYALWKVLPATLFLAAAFGWVGYSMLMGLASGHVLALVVAAVGALVCLPLLSTFVSSIVHPWRHRGPVVILDLDGVTDVRKEPDFLPWEEVAGVKLGVGEAASFLCFELRRPAGPAQEAPRLGALGVVAKRLRSLGDWNITLRLLACRRGEVLDAARTLRQRNTRRRVVELNKAKESGWSGTLG